MSVPSLTSFTTRPKQPLPPGACDTHFHIYDHSLPRLEGASIPTLSGTIEDYVKLKNRVGLTRFVIVHAISNYGYDNTVSLKAMQVLSDGTDNTRGVTCVPVDITDAALENLHRKGFRGIRFSAKPGDTVSGGLLTLAGVQKLAPRIAQLGWHIQVQQVGTNLADLEPVLRKLPVDIVIDHMGRFPIPLPPGYAHWKAMLRLVDSGRCWVKLSAPYHGSKSGPPNYEDSAALGRELIAAAPERMLWGTNWPHPPVKSNFPDEAICLDALAEWAGNEATRVEILVDNPAKLYGFAQPPR